MVQQQQQSLPPPPVMPAQVPQVLAGGLAAPQPQPTGSQLQAMAAPQQAPPGGAMAPGGHNPPAANVLGQNVQNPVLNEALYQAMVQQGTNSGVTFDDLANYVITQSRGNVRYRAPNQSEELQKYFQNC